MKEYWTACTNVLSTGHMCVGRLCSEGGNFLGKVGASSVCSTALLSLKLSIKIWVFSFSFTLLASDVARILLSGQFSTPQADFLLLKIVVNKYDFHAY